MRTTQVARAAAIAVSLLFAFNQIFGRIHAVMMQVHMVSKMLGTSALFILAIVRSYRPTELKRQHDHQEDGNPAAHDLEYIG